MIDAEAAADACRLAEEALARSARGVARDDDDLDRALAALSSAKRGLAAGSRDGPRIDAYQAQVLRTLGRRREAATAYADALIADRENAEALFEGIRDLLDDLGGLEDAERVALSARERHPGRAWQWDALVEESRRRVRLDALAPISPEDLARLRAEVLRRLRDAPCPHEDDRRPVAAAAAHALGFDAPRVLAWLSELGACCCDCQVARVPGPREQRLPS
jgi:tetratricopeptide (TPR) repeat protein